MRRLLCRLGAHAWALPVDWHREEIGRVVSVKGVQKCGRRGCPMVRDYHRSWAPKADVVGPVRRIR